MVKTHPANNLYNKLRTQKKADGNTSLELDARQLANTTTYYSKYLTAGPELDLG